MISQEQIIDLISTQGNVLTSDGQVLGSMGRLLVDDVTGQPAWITVDTGRPHAPELFVPLPEATAEGNDLRVPYSAKLVEDSPRMSQDGHLSPEEEEHLLRHYNLIGDIDETDGGTPLGMDASRTATDNAMTRSEERLRVGTETRESGKVRISKHVVTETVTETIPVRREEIRIERIPIADADTDTDSGSSIVVDGAAFDEGEYEIVLHEERPVIQVETVAVERITLNKETVSGEETVSDEVRKEIIETDGVDGNDQATGR